MSERTESERGVEERLRERAYRMRAKHRVSALLDEAADALVALREERDQLRYWNSAVAVCAEHVDFIVSMNPEACVLCDLDKAEVERDEALAFDAELFKTARDRAESAERSLAVSEGGKREDAAGVVRGAQRAGGSRPPRPVPNVEARHP